LVLQGFSLIEISGILGIDPKEENFKKFALIAYRTEQAFKDVSKKLKVEVKPKQKKENEQ
jgi:hypothetical protein